MSNLYSDEELLELIDDEGFGYAIYEYLNPEEIESDETRVLWSTAHRALVELAEHLGVH